MAAIDAIGAMPGVLSAALIYHQFDELDKQCEDMP
jgi:nitrate reductase NapD